MIGMFVGAAGAALSSAVVFYGVAILIKRQGVDARLSASLAFVMAALFLLLTRGTQLGLSHYVPWLLLFFFVQCWRLRRRGNGDDEVDVQER